MLVALAGRVLAVMLVMCCTIPQEKGNETTVYTRCLRVKLLCHYNALQISLDMDMDMRQSKIKETSLARRPRSPYDSTKPSFSGAITVMQVRRNLQYLVIFYTNSSCFCLARCLALMSRRPPNLHQIIEGASLAVLPCCEPVKGSDKAVRVCFWWQTRPSTQKQP